MLSTNSPAMNCCEHTLSATRACGQPALRHSATACAARRITQALSSTIRPDCSATCRNSAAGTMRPLPCRQRSNASTAVASCVRQRHLRLEVQHQIVHLDRAPQRLLGLKAIRGGDEHFRAVHAGPIAAQLLGPEERCVRGTQQRGAIGCMLRIDGGADAHADQQFALVDRDRTLELRHHTRGARLHLFHCADTRQMSVNSSPPSRATKPRSPAASRSRSLMSRSTRSPNSWPRLSLIDLEVVEIDEQHGDALLLARGAPQSTVQVGKEVTPIGERRERIVVRQQAQLSRALRDALLELCLVRAHGLFGRVAAPSPSG